MLPYMDGLKQCDVTYIGKYDLDIKKKKKEILPFVATWIKLEGIMLSKLSQRKTNIIEWHTDSMDMSLSKLWGSGWKGKTGVPQSMGSQRFGHD